MMRKFAVWLVGLALFLLGAASPLDAATSGPANVLVVYNSANSQSVALAQSYQSARSIPDANMLAVSGPPAWAPDGNIIAILSDYKTYIYTPVINAVSTIQSAGGRIDYVVLCRNLPFTVAGEGITMSLDGALMSVGGNPVGQDSDEQLNGFLNFAGTFADYKLSGVTTIPFLVSRLDGTSWIAAQRLITNAQTPRLRTESVYLNDASTFVASAQGNFVTTSDITSTNALLTAAGIPTTVVSGPFSRPPSAVTGYFSYGLADTTFKNTLYLGVRFNPGGIGATDSWGSAINLRAAGNFAGQMTALLQNGAVGTVGYVGSPTGDSWYILDGFPQPDLYLDAYLVEGRTLADSFFLSLKYIGYTQLLVGDPLDTYLGPGFVGLDLTGSVVSGTAVGGFDSWPVGTDRGQGDGGVTNGGAVGGGSWMGGGGGGGGGGFTW